MVTEQGNDLEFTGERFTPECVREIWYEHWHRYAFALGLARGKRVLDAACGEGYGAHLLAGVAAQVNAVDISPAAIQHAQARYVSRDNLEFSVGDAAALKFPDHHFDVIVSFETLEHLQAQEPLVAGFARMLAEDGILLISSPDKHNYSEVAGFRNEFHVRELYRHELLDLLRPHFIEVRLYAQKLLFQSVLWSVDGAGQGAIAQTAAEEGAIQPGFDYAPLYYVAVCAKKSLCVDLPSMAVFGDREESVYSHYNSEVRKNMAAGARIAELEAELDRLRTSTPDKTSSRWPRWLRR